MGQLRAVYTRLDEKRIERKINNRTELLPRLGLDEKRIERKAHTFITREDTFYVSMKRGLKDIALFCVTPQNTACLDEKRIEREV